MRLCFLFLGALLAGCGSDVTILSGGEAPGPVDGPVAPPPPDDDDEPPVPEPGPTCGGSEATVSVSLEGACDYGVGGLDYVTSIEPAGSIDGVRVVANNCTITVGGIGADIADALTLFEEETLQYVAAPNRIEIYPLAICPACTDCPCAHPLPILHAGEGLSDQTDAFPTPLEVAQGATQCTIDDGGCPWEGWNLDFSAYEVQAGFPGDLAILLGTGSAAEGEEVAIENTTLVARTLRANGPSAECLSGAIPGHAWAVYFPAAPTL